MADQDFNIKVVTTADTSGIRQTDAELSKLVGRSDALRAQFPGLPAGQLPDDLATSTGKAATEAERIANNALFAGANLGRARQEAIVLARELATGGNVTRTLGSLLGALGPEIAVAAVGTFALYNGFKGANEEAAKLIKITDDLGKDIQAAGIKQQESIKEVTKPADVTKIAETAITELGKVSAKNKDIQAQTLGWFEKSVEFVRESFQRGVNIFPVAEDIVKPYSAALRVTKENAKAEEDAAKANVRNAIERATKQREHVEGLEKEISSVDKLENQMRYLHGLQDSLDKSAGDYGKKWLDAQKNIANVQNQLKQVLATQLDLAKQTADAIKKTASDERKSPDQFNKDQADRIDDYRAKQQAAEAELDQMKSEGGPHTDAERFRMEELRKFTSPEAQQDFAESLEKRNLERYEALQQGIIDPNKRLEESLGSEGANKYREAQNRLAEIHQHERTRDVTGGRTDEGSRMIATKLDQLLAIWR